MNTNLSEGFLFASGALGALSLLLVIALVRSGVDGMTKIWPLLGPLFGGLLGTVTTSYFAEAKVAGVRAEAAGQFAIVASNVSSALDALQYENAQLRGASLGSEAALLQDQTSRILGGHSSDIAPPPPIAVPAQ